jgi:hypothetical protein
MARKRLTQIQAAKLIRSQRAQTLGGDVFAKVENKPIALVEEGDSRYFFQFNLMRMQQPRGSLEIEGHRVLGFAHPELISLLRG